MAVLSPYVPGTWCGGAAGSVHYVVTSYTVSVVLITVGVVKVLDGMMIPRLPTCAASSESLYPMTSSMVGVVLLTVVILKVLNGLVWWWSRYVTATSHITNRGSSTRARSRMSPHMTIEFTDRRMTTRTVATQSMCTYRRKLATPVFEWIARMGDDGVWID